MAERLDPKETITIEELAVSNMWEMPALVKLLERKGLITEQEVLDMIQELRRIVVGRTSPSSVALPKS